MTKIKLRKKELLHFTLYGIIIYLTVGTLNPVRAATQPSRGHETHFCGVIDGHWNKRYTDQYPNRRYARTFAANLNVGEPRTVRMIYFLPNDRPYRAEVVQRMKDEILKTQTFYAEQMEAHGYGRRTFRVETDAQGAPKVHRMDGKHPDSHYPDNTDRSLFNEVEEVFDLDANIYFIVIDNSIYGIGSGDGEVVGGVGFRRGKNGGSALVSDGFNWELAAHELGHAFGLDHDFRDDAYIMSYGPGWDRLSVCHAEYLSVHPYFNLNIPIEEGEPPTIELTSPRLYPAGAQSVPVRLKVNDLDGLHQLILSVTTTMEQHPAAGSLEVEACRGLAGDRDTVVRFNYDGVIPSDSFTNLSDSAIHPISVRAVDTDGDVRFASFRLAEISPYHITTFENHTDEVGAVVFSPVDPTLLATGSEDGTVKLWDLVTQQDIATLEGHTAQVNSMSFSSDGSTLAIGAQDGTVKLWDVETERDIATLEKHTTGVSSVSFSSDGSTLATGAYDETVKLWDVETERDIATFRHREGVYSVSFSSDGSTLATGAWDGTVKLWDVMTQRNIATLRSGGGPMVFSPVDATLLATGSWEGTVKLWDVEMQQDIATLEGHTFGVSSVSFSSDGSTLAAGSWDGTIKLWDISTRVNFATLGYGDQVLSVSFSSDDTTLASGTEGGRVELWDTSMLMGAGLEETAEIDIPDPNLRAAIAEAIGLPPNTPIFQERLADLTRLEARNANISNLTGLESTTNLTSLYLDGNSVSDISAVAGLTSLTRLYLDGNSVSNISAVSGLTNLTQLHLWNNLLSDISALSGLTNLTYLDFGVNSVSDISSVAGLTSLARLDLMGNSISDISALSGLTNLTYLDLIGNSISDISPLAANTGLGSGDEVYLQQNPLSYLSIHKHIPTLQSRGVTVEFDNRAHPALLKISGDNQKGTPSTPLSQPFVVEAQDENGAVLAGVQVTFAVTAGGGSLSVTNTTTDANGRAQSTLTLGPDMGTNTVSVSATAIEGVVTFNAISDTLPTDYHLSIPAGISLIHVPLKVTIVDGVEQTIESIADLYDVLGGANVVTYLNTHDSQTQEWFGYFSPSDRGTSADRELTDDMGILAQLTTPVSVRLTGSPLGTNGNSTIALNQGLNLVGLPLKDPRITRVSDLFALDGIGGNVPMVIFTDNGELKAIVLAGAPGDIPLIGGQAFILAAQRAATVTISGDGWYNTSETAAAPLLSLKGVEVGDTTPVLGLRGSIVDEEMGANRASFRVIVRNLSTGRAVAAVTKDENYSRPDKQKSERVDYQVTVVDVETKRAAQIGDILEISVRSPSPLIGVQPIRYTVTVEDVKRGLIQLTELVAYEIPAETELLHNYPNPFNPETWIPYRLAEDAFVTLTIYDQTGQIVRTLEVGHRIASVYENRSKAIHWDGRNDLGEQVASGVYFYHLSAGDYSATRKMLILK